MEIRIAEEKWTAEILFSPQSEIAGLIHCSVTIKAESKEDALNGAQYVLDLFAKGRETFIRVKPEATFETCFDTKELRISGFVRFSFSLKAGAWQVVEPSASVPLGFAEVRA